MCTPKNCPPTAPSHSQALTICPTRSCPAASWSGCAAAPQTNGYEPWRLRINGDEAERSGDRLASGATPRPPRSRLAGHARGVEDRDADVWEALLAVADLAGGHWPLTARDGRVRSGHRIAAATAEYRGAAAARHQDRVRRHRRSTSYPPRTSFRGLVNMPESPWTTIRKGEPIDPRSLASRLRKYGIVEAAPHGPGSVEGLFARSVHRRLETLRRGTRRRR